MGSCMFILQVAPKGLRLLALNVYDVAQKGLVSARTVFYILELEFEKEGWKPFPG